MHDSVLPARLLVLAVLVAVSAACGIDDGGDRLATLAAQPMATYELDGAAPTRRTEMAGGTSAMASPSEITSVFAVPPGSALDAVERIAADARGLGWELEPKEPNGYWGRRQVDGITAQLSITARATGDEVTVALSSRS